MLANILLSGLVMAIPLVGAVTAAPVRPDRPALVIAAPWADAAAILDQVGASPLMTGARGIGAETLLSETQIAAVQGRRDVWLMLDLGRLTALCGRSREDI
ncbi:hypothetical protein HMH01_09095 [Halovulum dunhuangense]|uniref:Uncharacterized protein n=1 Tax=Halovulum dunhuangense TaxID=1505036 RepID=A0A849L2Y0_9RHOB|nr:hypothetical protein [Halovulum dunhuangense]NNU80590.1 hypothetical protein [Halovulum dunhuangense]